ncbi:Rz1-like lysis system protein LysC [Basfia succiniciproducens]|uniref:Rz1-like lysis system protein LysC n=1 Tax=Basfia succiniciproducens TaxID=653940 RepID=UPI003FCCC6A9
MRYKKMKIGAMSACLMTLVACSTNEKPPIKQPILCPTASTTCKQLNVNIKTNADLANALDASLNMTELCITENIALKNCISDFNKNTGTTNK